MSRRAAAARLLATTAAVVWSFAAMESGAQTGAIEEVVVTAATGSRIVRQGDSPSPLSSHDGQTLLDSGLKDIRDLVGDGQSQLTTLEANVTGFLPWRDAGYAAGVQYRDQSVDFFYDDITRNDGSRTFAGRRTLGDPNLKRETSSAFNAGVSWHSAGNWAFNADYWRYSFEDVLRKANAQAIVNAGSYDPRSSDPRGQRLFVSFGLRR